MPDTHEIKQVAVSAILNFVSGSIKSAKVTIDGVEQDHPIWKTKFTDGTVRKYVKLDSSVRGFVSAGTLIDAQGRVWMEKFFDHQKGQDGYVLVFPYRQEIGKITVLDEINRKAANK